MKNLPFNEAMSGLLSKPGDKLTAEVTKSGRQVMKINTSEIKQSFTRYPSTGTKVITTVIKDK